MASCTREFEVEHKDVEAEANALIGTTPPEPQPGEEKLKCSRVGMVRHGAGTKIVLEAVYESAQPSTVQKLYKTPKK